MGRGGGVPVKKTVFREIAEEFREQPGGGGVEGRIEGRGEFRMLGGLRFEFAEAEGDRGLDLLGEVEVAAGDGREELVDEVQATQVVAGALHFGGLPRLLTSSTNSATSRNSL